MKTGAVSGTNRFHTVVIGGGCLGCASAIALARRLGRSEGICIVEKAVMGAGLTSRNSGIVRAVNSSPATARMSRQAAELWKSIENVWGVPVPVDPVGALWIIRSSDTTFPISEAMVTASGDDALVQPFDAESAVALTRGTIRTNDDEAYYFEPDALLLNPEIVLESIRNAVTGHQIAVREHCAVEGFETDGNGRIKAVKTGSGDLECEFVVNAAGGWSPEIFADLNVPIPVTLSPVFAADWLTGHDEIPARMPIIADYVTRAYFRTWPGNRLRMHQPRDRRTSSIALMVSDDGAHPASANLVFEPSNYSAPHDLLDSYRQKIQYRFSKMDAPLYAGGFVAYYDVTPDLKFILGQDSRVENLVHCLGAGQALKFAPVFGQMIAGTILGDPVSNELAEFSIKRFENRSDEPFSPPAHGEPERRREG